eukprot:GHVP01017871.1.p1 GENE.GHVP01017871.1~~GHVP01017871.1.p1  ORF type:complete len:434 (-),score=71.65 GHVP01017871.1:614-1915(-)
MHTFVANCVYIRSLSPLVTSADIRQVFGAFSDEIIDITFKNFPGTSQKYCQVNMKTSEGVTKATGLNGHVLRGVSMVVTVIDPMGAAGAGLSSSYSSGQTYSSSSSNYYSPDLEAQRLALLARLKIDNLGLDLANLGTLPSSITQQITAAQLTLAQKSLEPEAHQIARTVRVDNVQDKTVLEVSTKLVRSFPEISIKDIRVDQDTNGKRFALAELNSIEMAELLRNYKPRQYEASKENIDDFKFSQSATTVRPRDPENISFDLPTQNPVPVALQQVTNLRMQEKMNRVKSLAEKMGGLKMDGLNSRSQSPRKRDNSQEDRRKKQEPLRGGSYRRNRGRDEDFGWRRKGRIVEDRFPWRSPDRSKRDSERPSSRNYKQSRRSLGRSPDRKMRRRERSVSIDAGRKDRSHRRSKKSKTGSSPREPRSRSLSRIRN